MRFPELGEPLTELVRALRAGLPTERVDALTETLGLPATHVASLLGIPTSTLARRRAGGRLDRDESERTFRLARLVERATEVLGGVDDARDWLTTPQFALGGAVPLVFADTEPGAQEVMNVLGRIEHALPL
jgi:putative toxin-antitoxin system antitoxin component (TIGR02293 family)